MHPHTLSKALYVNPYTDFGFKKIFGEEASKPLLMDFLNSLLPPHHQIAELNFKNNEQLGTTTFDRKAIYDIYCESTSGEKFIVELQRAKQNYFKDRTLYYSTFPIAEQAEKGEWNYKLNAVYCVAILDFTFDDHVPEPERSEVVHTVQLKDQNNKIFYDKFTLIYLEMPNFRKTDTELTSQLDKWLYFIKNLEDIQQIPEIFKDHIFTQAFETAKLAGLSREDWQDYERTLKVYRDNKAVMDYALDEARQEGFEDGKQEGIAEGRAEGIAEGRAEGRAEGEIQKALEIARSMKSAGMAVEQIAQFTGLSVEEIQRL